MTQQEERDVIGCTRIEPCAYDHTCASHKLFARFQAEVAALREERDAAVAKINSPETRDFVEAVMREAAHQRERWGEREGYSELEWAGVATWLVGKAGVTMFQTNGDAEKYLHRIITVAALAANWHRNALRESALGEGTA